MRGTRFSAVDSPGLPTVHPRACGEHTCLMAVPMVLCGSSPRMRGTPHIPNLVIQQARFIPAHAGNTVLNDLEQGSEAVHPRACGEHSSSGSALATTDGSSPRMRGTLRHGLDRLLDRRFIPAHAGNTVLVGREREQDAVHPRACGEHSSCSPTVLPLFGSSPRMRGTR